MGRADKVLSGLATLRQEALLCDIELRAEDQTVSAHKAVLAAASPYFRAMFSGNFSESQDRVVQLGEITFQVGQSKKKCVEQLSLSSWQSYLL